MNKADEYYIKNLNNINDNGCYDKNPRPKYKDDTQAHSKYITHVFEEYDLTKNEFPIPTLRNTAIKIGINEIMWIYQDQNSSLDSAHKRGINWWDSWDIGNKTIGLRYGATVSKYDLLNKLLNGLKNEPFSRRHIINLLQENDLSETEGLYPCAFETEWSVREIDNIIYLDLFLNQRSNDYIMAGAINKIQYVALQMMVAGHLGYKVGKFSHFVNNLHIYDRHFNAVNELLMKTPLEIQPYIELIGNKNFYEYTIEDFKIYNIEGITKIQSPLEIAI